METKDFDGVSIEECPQCKGTWFDNGELKQAKDQADPDLNWLDFEIWKHEDQFRVSAHPIKCPKDQVNLVAVNYGDTDIEIDYCPKCHGVWLDDGEFCKIIDTLHQELTTKDMPDYVKASLDEAKEVVAGPDKTSSEWKDFSTVIRMMQYRLFSEKPRLLTELIEGQKGMPIW
jgi:Zn-finger nucleic acid-binding protein